MKKPLIALALLALGSTSAMAQDYHFEVTNMSDATLAPLIVLDASVAAPFMFNNGKMSEDFTTTVLKGDPRPMNGKIGSGVAGPVLGKSGPPGVLISAGEVAETDLYIEADTLRFYAKHGYGPEADRVVSGVYDISMGPGTVMLHSYDIGHYEGTNEIKLASENAVKIVITAN